MPPIVGIKLTYEGIKAKAYAPENKQLSLKRALIITCIPSKDRWITYDELADRVSDVLETPRINVHEDLCSTLHYFNNIEYVKLASKAPELSTLINQIVARNHGGVKGSDLVNSLKHQPDVMLPDDLEQAIIKSVEDSNKLNYVRYATNKIFVYNK